MKQYSNSTNDVVKTDRLAPPAENPLQF